MKNLKSSAFGLSFLIALLCSVVSKLKPKKQEKVWNDGYPPPHLPRSFIQEGMRLSDDKKGVIPTWRYSRAYYSNLV
jgi:hypothetical protein